MSFQPWYTVGPDNRSPAELARCSVDDALLRPILCGPIAPMSKGICRNKIRHALSCSSAGSRCVIIGRLGKCTEKAVKTNITERVAFKEGKEKKGGCEGM